MPKSSTREGAIAGAASVVGSATMASRVLGYARDAAIAYVFGAGMYSDAFFVAFRISNLLRRLLGEGALTSSFIPIFTEEYHLRSAEGSRALVSSVFTLFMFILTAVAIIGIIFSGPLVSLMSPGFTEDPYKFALTVKLTQLMFPYMVFIGLMALAMGVLNSLKHFAAPAIAPIFFNLSIIACLFIIAPALNQPVYALAIGVLIGGVLQFLLQLPFLKRYGMLPSLSFRFSDPGIGRIMKLMGPAAFGVGVYQLNIFVTLWFASRLAEGSVSYLYYAGRLMELPMGVFGVAITTALLPALSLHAAKKEWVEFKGSLSFVLRMLNFLMIPAAVGLFVLSLPIIELLFTRGSFGEEAARSSATALSYYSIGLVPISLSRVLTSAFYSLKDTATPVWVALGAFFCNAIACVLLVGPMGFGGLALATSIAGVLNMVILFVILSRRLGSFGGGAVLSAAIKNVIASGIMGAAIYLVLVNSGYASMSGLTRPLFVILLLIMGVVLYLVLARMLRLSELEFIKGFFKRGG
jgi:putative peptidoglycan lipid II flippase